MLNELEYNGQKVFKQVFNKNEVYSGPLVDLAPDILLIPNEFVIHSSLDGKLYDISSLGGYHDLRGILLVYGDGIRKGYKINRAKIYDIAPTILHVFGLPIPNDMDGRVLVEVFEENSDFAKREVTYVNPSYYYKSEEEILKEKIRDLRLKGKFNF